MISIRHLTKSYETKSGTHLVVDDVSLDIPDEVSIGILGRNGGGKSTLLRLIGGIEQPDSGEVVRTSRVSWPIGFGGAFHGALSGRENTRFVARLYGADVDEVAEKTLEFAEIDEYFDMPVKTYSSGMRARLAFGLSMAVDFDVYLIDELTAVGDQRFQEKSRKAFKDKRRHASVVIVSHQIKTIKDYADRFAVMKEGKLEVFDDLKEAEAIYKTL